jgi:transcriptional regulator with XRE-family HTH domain
METGMSTLALCQEPKRPQGEKPVQALVTPSQGTEKRPVLAPNIVGAIGNEFGPLLKSLRERRGISQSKLAAKAEFDHSYMSRLEGGARMPTRDAVDRIGEAMDLSEGEHDMLLAAAGFLPRDFNAIISSEPILAEIFYVLQDSTVPEDYKKRFRQTLQLMAEMARQAVFGAPGQAAA